MRARLGGSAVTLLLLLSGCAGSSPTSAADSTTAGSSAAEPLPTLPARAVPYLASSLKPLTAASLVREAQSPALATDLRVWGFQAASERYFQGESRRLQVVDSRTLRFRSRSGASAFVTFARSHLGAYLGTFPRLARLAVGSRRGFLATGQECQCHLANPSYLAVVAGGETVSWLEINGPGATKARLSKLLAQAV